MSSAVSSAPIFFNERILLTFAKPPAIPLFDSRFTTSFPQASDPEVGSEPPSCMENHD